MNFIIRILTAPIGQLPRLLFPKKRNSQEVFGEQVIHRDRLYGDIETLENSRVWLVGQGKSSESIIAKRRLANQITLLDGDLRRLNIQVSQINKQLSVQQTHRHNETMIDLTVSAHLPSTEQLAETAAIAEERVGQLDVAVDMLPSIEVGSNSEISEAEQAVLAEFNDAPVCDEQHATEGMDFSRFGDAVTIPPKEPNVECQDGLEMSGRGSPFSPLPSLPREERVGGEIAE